MDYITGDIITLKNDDILRVVYDQEDDIVCADWIEDRTPKRICVHKDDIKFIERTVFYNPSI